VPDEFSAHRAEHQIQLDKARAVVLVVDMLNDFCKPGGAMVLPGAEKLYPAQRELLKAARENRVPVIWIIDSHRKGLRRDREWLKRAPHCVEGSWGAEVVAELEPRADEMRVYKHRYSGFFQTDLDLVLKDHKCNQLIIFGVVTNICVRSTVHDAFFNGYTVLVPEDCCAATGPREQESSLYDIATHFGIVTDSKSVIAAITSGAPLTNQERT
jgi:ureidoacrylate peracid hydrolase